MSMADPCKVYIIGHSYIRRLRDYLEKVDIRNLKLDAGNFTVRFRARGGLRIRELALDPTFLNFSEVPDICFLQIGGNDIKESTNSYQLAEDIISVAEFLQQGKGVCLVLIGQLFRRMPHVTCRGYNRIVFQINGQLKRRAASTPGVRYWQHRGFWADMKHLGPDGVHLLCSPQNDHPMRKYLRSVRNAVIISSRSMPKAST